MTSHPRRSTRILPPPTPDEIRAARAAVGHSHLVAAAVIGVSKRRWEGWEQSEAPMLPALYQLYLLLTGQTTVSRAREALTAQ